MKHPSDAVLALYAGDDLGCWARLRTGRHLGGCERCRREVAAYQDLQAAVPELADLAAAGWNRLAAEMKANIRLGLEAGACVPETAHAGSPWLGFRSAVACASMAVLLLASLALVERPAPRAARPAAHGVVLRATSGGIEWNDGRQAMSLLHGNARGITLMVGAQGSMRARYVDADTGYVTVNNVYAQ
jgi:hypothetical protein